MVRSIYSIMRKVDMQYVIDAIILLPVLVSVAIAYQKGFFSTLLSFMSGFVSLISSYIISPYVYDYLYKTEVNAKIKESAMLMINDAEQKSLGERGTAGYFDSIVDSLTFPDPVKDIIRAGSGEGGANIFDAEAFKMQIADTVTELCMRILSYVLVFAAITLIFFVIRAAAKSIKKLPVLKEADKMLGAVVGFFRGIIISLVIIVLLLFMRFNNADEGFGELVDNSVIMSSVMNGEIFENMALHDNDNQKDGTDEAETRSAFAQSGKSEEMRR